METLTMQGGELKSIRQSIGLSQIEMAEALGMTSTYIGMMERGDRTIEKRTALAALALADRHICGGNQDVEPRDDDIPLAEATIQWSDLMIAPNIRVIRHETQWDDDLDNSYGDGNMEWHVASTTGRLVRLYELAHSIALDGILTPQQIDQAFSVIPEYRASRRV